MITNASGPGHEGHCGYLYLVELLKNQMDVFPDAGTETDDYVMAARFYNLCRARGIQGSNTDFLICAAAVRRQAAIFTTDRDFDLYARHLPISLHHIR